MMQPTRELKAEIAKLYDQRSVLVADLMQQVSHARGLGDAEGLDEKTKEHLTFDVVQMIASWEGAGQPPGPEIGETGAAVSAIVELEEAIADLEDRLPEN